LSFALFYENAEFKPPVFYKERLKIRAFNIKCKTIVFPYKQLFTIIILINNMVITQKVMK